jgi:ZIP family zinc transporter
MHQCRGDGGVILLVGALPFISTLLGGLAVFRLQHRLHAVMALAAGVIVATALVDLLPESIELIGTDRAPFMAGAAAVIGYLLYASVEAFIHQSSYEHGHDPLQDPGAPHEHSLTLTKGPTILGWVAPGGLIVHSALDGLAIGLGFEAGTEVGLIVTLAVVVHDFADGLNVVTLALAGGQSRNGALVLLALDAAAIIFGLAISQLIVLSPEALGLVIGVMAGAFIAIGAGHLLPEAQHRSGANVSPLVLLTIAGAALVVAIRLLLA